MKWRNASRKIIHYFRHDFREIAWPSSLPDPPSLASQNRKLTYGEHIEVFRRAWRDYLASWRGPIKDPRHALQEEAERKMEAKESERNIEEGQSTLMEDLAVAAKSGAKGMKPFLQRIYLARASAYRDAVKEFVVGYQEGLALAARKEGEHNPKLSDRGGGNV